MAKTRRTPKRPRLFDLLSAWALLVWVAVAPGFAAGALPEKPARWVSDRAGVLSPAAAAALDGKLEAFEKAQGSQVLIAIFPALPDAEVLEEYTQKVAESWRVGRAQQDDGVVLFLFVEDRALRLEVGYGLEGALTDLESKHILQDALIPHLRNGDYDGGFTAAADAILVAIRGEYTPDATSPARRGGARGGFVFYLVFIVLLILISAARRGRGRHSGWTGGGPWNGGGGGWGGGGFGGGGGFSGGGGSFGGGGASARW